MKLVCLLNYPKRKSLSHLKKSHLPTGALVPHTVRQYDSQEVSVLTLLWSVSTSNCLQKSFLEFITHILVISLLPSAVRSPCRFTSGDSSTIFSHTMFSPASFSPFHDPICIKVNREGRPCSGPLSAILVVNLLRYSINYLFICGSRVSDLLHLFSRQ